MNCQEFLRELANIEQAHSPERMAQMQAHTSSCPACRATWSFAETIPSLPEPSTALLERLTMQMDGLPLVSVQPLPAPAVFVSKLAGIVGLVSAIGILALGRRGLQQLSVMQIELFTGFIVAVFLGLAALLYQEYSPARRSWIPAWLAGSLTTLGYAIFATGFFTWNPSAPEFIKSGLVCLSIGTGTALVTAYAMTKFVHQGFALHPGSARIALASIASLAGLTVLQVFCPKQEAAHLLVAHGMVLPVVAFIADRLGRRLLPS